MRGLDYFHFSNIVWNILLSRICIFNSFYKLYYEKLENKRKHVTPKLTRPKFYTVSWVYIQLESALEMDSGKLQLLHFVLSESSEFYSLMHSLKLSVLSIDFCEFCVLYWRHDLWIWGSDNNQHFQLLKQKGSLACCYTPSSPDLGRRRQAALWVWG